MCSASVSYLFIAATGLVCTSLLAPAGYVFCFYFLFIYCRHRPGLHLSTCSSRLCVLLLFLIYLLPPPAWSAPLYLLEQAQRAICYASVSYLFIAATGLVCTSLLARAGTASYMFCFCFLFIYCRHRPGLQLSTCSSRLYVLLLFLIYFFILNDS